MGQEGYPEGHTGFAVKLDLTGPYDTFGECKKCSVVGFGRSKKSAQHHAAHLALKELYDIEIALPEGAGELSSKGPNKAAKGPTNAGWATLILKFFFSKKRSLKNSKSYSYVAQKGENGGDNYLIQFNSLHPQQSMNFRQEGTHKNVMFFCDTEINNQMFTGRGRSKKQAKRDCCMRVLRQVDNIQVQG